MNKIKLRETSWRRKTFRINKIVLKRKILSNKCKQNPFRFKFLQLQNLQIIQNFRKEIKTQILRRKNSIISMKRKDYWEKITENSSNNKSFCKKTIHNQLEKTNKKPQRKTRAERLKSKLTLKKKQVNLRIFAQIQESNKLRAS